MSDVEFLARLIHVFEKGERTSLAKDGSMVDDPEGTVVVQFTDTCAKAIGERMRGVLRSLRRPF